VVEERVVFWRKGLGGAAAGDLFHLQPTPSTTDERHQMNCR
jgi:hypothetical protein